jgi:hypothetical protein
VVDDLLLFILGATMLNSVITLLMVFKLVSAVMELKAAVERLSIVELVRKI